MIPYILKGLVLPERAAISLGPMKMEFFHPSSGLEAQAKLNIVLNQITVWVYSEHEWDIFDLRNVAEQLVVDILAIVGFLKGYAYNVEIRQIINDGKDIDYVFGINMPCIEKRNEHLDFEKHLNKLLPKVAGDHGIFIKRCLNDLVMAMKQPGDTGFYCFRAIEALKQYCKNRYGLEKEADQWKKVSDISGYGKDHIEVVRRFAFPARHGDILPITSSDREEIFIKAWDIVEAFLENA
ncbi:MAG: hypothetical protein HQK72_08775 [Desulfamplus sp.]|nr:hypothetical protein [Desulfamplus sp.]